MWIDVPLPDEAAASALVKPLGLHEGAVRDCVERNTVPKVHVYADHVFVVLHAPEMGLADMCTTSSSTSSSATTIWSPCTVR